MSATPGARNEYSKGPDPSGGAFEHGQSLLGALGRGAAAPTGSTAGLVLTGAFLGGLLLVVAEFTTLYKTHVATISTPLSSVSSGSHNSYAMIPLALLAAALGIGVWRTRSRSALLAIGVVGVVALLIALIGDLPDAHASGLARSASHYVSASSTPSAGLYMETLGAVLLISTCGLGSLMLGAGRARPASGPDDSGGEARSESTSAA